MLEKFESFKRMFYELNLLTRSQNTLNTYKKGLSCFMEVMNVNDLDVLISDIKNGKFNPNELYKNFLLELAKKNVAPKTIITWSSALKKFFKANDIKIDEDIKIRAFNIHEDILPTKEELKFILNNSDLRTRVIILLMLSSGLRIDEVRNLQLKDLDLNSNPPIIKVRSKFAKERKARITFMSSQCKEELLKYLSTRKNLTEDSYLITTRKEKILSYSQIQYMLNKAFKIIAKKEGKRYSLHPHVLRKFFKTTMISSGVPAPIVDRLVGHSRYLAEEYELYSLEQLKEWYLKVENNLII